MTYFYNTVTAYSLGILDFTHKYSEVHVVGSLIHVGGLTSLVRGRLLGHLKMIFFHPLLQKLFDYLFSNRTEYSNAK